LNGRKIKPGGAYESSDDDSSDEEGSEEDSTEETDRDASQLIRYADKASSSGAVPLQYVDSTPIF